MTKQLLLILFHTKNIFRDNHIMTLINHNIRGLTCKLSADIERVQRVAVNIMVDNAHYEQACAMLGLKPLHVRRQELCERFAVHTASSKSRHNDLFELEKNGTHYTRSNDSKFREHICNKTRFFKSPLPFLTRTLNNI